MSDTPQKTGRIAQIRDAYRAIKSIDPKLGQWMLLAALLTAAVIIGLGIWGGGFWILYAVVIAIPAAALAATLVMNRRGNNAMYAALEGKAGAVGAALQGIGRRGWYAALEPVAVDAPRGTKANDMSGAAMVFRALGRPGVVLIGEGPDARVLKLLKAEEKKASRVAPGVPIHLWTAGDAEGQVPVRKIAGKLTRMRPVLTKAEVSAVNKRLKSLGGMRPPIPAGMDPHRARVDRRGLRGK